MMPFDPSEKLAELLALNHEKEWVERKTATQSFDFNKLGKYFSALSNEANLHNQSAGWLIFGVADDGTVVGTNYHQDRAALDSLKHQIAQQTSNQVTFREIHEVDVGGKRVLMFEIPPAMRGAPTSWKGYCHGRDGESLVALNPQEYETIRGQAMAEDWTVEICHGATVADLAPGAIQLARGNYATRHPRLAGEVSNWDDVTFLDKAKVTIRGAITRAAILLLGRPESDHFLSPAPGVISWILKDEANEEMDYEHFGPPWVLRVDEVWRKIRNLRYRHMPGGTLFPLEVNQYDDWVFREALHNCIAHQDYTLGGRITVVEFPDQLILKNPGAFIPKSVEDVIEQDAPESRYRNPWLAGAMMNLNMIDTIGSGIKRMFIQQRKRYFPLPDYDLESNSVSVRIMGHILDPNYVQHLAGEAELELHDVMLLDKVQKGARISKEDAKRLRKRQLVEGRYPHLHISARIAALSKQKAKYLHDRGLSEGHYAELILEHIRKFGSITRSEADDLLWPKLPNVLNDKQKKNKVHRILQVVLKEKIKNTGTRSKPRYILFDSASDQAEENLN